MENFANEDILLRYPTYLRDNIQELWMNGQIGVSCMYTQINLPQCKLEYDCDIDNGNTFTLNIPYAGKLLQWTILFSDEDPTSPPDIDILNDNFLEDPDTDTISKHLPALTNWNVRDSKSLVNVVKQLIVLYKRHQLEKLKNEPKFIGVQEEYKRIKKELKMTDDEIEVYVDNNLLNILISLKLDFSRLPIYIQQTYFEPESAILLNPGIDAALLKISFLPTRVTSHLQLSPRVEKVFGDYTILHIPPYKKNDDMVEYIRLIYDLVEERINQINEHFRIKEEYFSILLSLHGLKVIEYDNINFSTGCFLFEIDDFYFLIYILITNKFPQEKPNVTLKSVYNKNPKGEPQSLRINNYPYNHQWKPEEMINTMLKHVHDIVPKFRNYRLNFN